MQQIRPINHDMRAQSGKKLILGFHSCSNCSAAKPLDLRRDGRRPMQGFSSGHNSVQASARPSAQSFGQSHECNFGRGENSGQGTFVNSASSTSAAHSSSYTGSAGAVPSKNRFCKTSCNGFYKTPYSGTFDNLGWYICLNNEGCMDDVEGDYLPVVDGESRCDRYELAPSRFLAQRHISDEDLNRSLESDEAFDNLDV